MCAWESSAYAWVVICKNKKVHRETNVLFGHKMPLGETDPYERPPALATLKKRMLTALRKFS